MPARTAPLVAATAVVIALVTWAWSDALLWGRIFEANALWQYDAAYQAGHEAVLIGLAALGAAALLPFGLRWSTWYVVTLAALAHGGAADLLYYILVGRPVPAALPWLDAPGHPFMPHPAIAASLAVWTIALAMLAGTASLALRRMP